MSNLETIKAPNLLNANFGANVKQQFDNINSNFQKLSNYDFTKGEPGENIMLYQIDMNNPKNSFDKSIINNLKLSLRNYANNQNDAWDSVNKAWSGIADKFTNNVQVNLFGENGENKNDILSSDFKDRKLQLIIQKQPGTKDEDLTNLNIISSLPFVFLDKRFHHKGLSDTIIEINNLNSDIFDDAVDLSCVCYAESNGVFKLVNTFPTLYYDEIVGDFCWRWQGNETGIVANGPRGAKGDTSNIVIAQYDGTESGQATITGFMIDSNVCEVPQNFDNEDGEIFIAMMKNYYGLSVDSESDDPGSTAGDSEVDKLFSTMNGWPVFLIQSVKTNEDIEGFYISTIQYDSDRKRFLAYRDKNSNYISSNFDKDKLWKTMRIMYNGDGQGDGTSVINDDCPGLIIPRGDSTDQKLMHMIYAEYDKGDFSNGKRKSLHISPVELNDDGTVQRKGENGQGVIEKCFDGEASLEINYPTTIKLINSDNSTVIDKSKITSTNKEESGTTSSNTGSTTIDGSSVAITASDERSTNINGSTITSTNTGSTTINGSSVAITASDEGSTNINGSAIFTSTINSDKSELNIGGNIIVNPKNYEGSTQIISPLKVIPAGSDLLLISNEDDHESDICIQPKSIRIGSSTHLTGKDLLPYIKEISIDFEINSIYTTITISSNYIDKDISIKRYIDTASGGTGTLALEISSGHKYARMEDVSGNKRRGRLIITPNISDSTQINENFKLLWQITDTIEYDGANQKGDIKFDVSKITTNHTEIKELQFVEYPSKIIINDDYVESEHNICEILVDKTYSTSNSISTNKEVVNIYGQLNVYGKYNNDEQHIGLDVAGEIVNNSGDGKNPVVIGANGLTTEGPITSKSFKVSGGQAGSLLMADGNVTKEKPMYIQGPSFSSKNNSGGTKHYFEYNQENREFCCNPGSKTCTFDKLQANIINIKSPEQIGYITGIKLSYVKFFNFVNVDLCIPQTSLATATISGSNNNDKFNWDKHVRNIEIYNIQNATESHHLPDPVHTQYVNFIVTYDGKGLEEDDAQMGGIVEVTAKSSDTNFNIKISGVYNPGINSKVASDIHVSFTYICK